MNNLIQKLNLTFNSGKNPKQLYYLKNYIRLITPKCFYRASLKKTLEKFNSYSKEEQEYILKRVNYYNKLIRKNVDINNFEKNSIKLSEQPMCRQKVYYFDTFEYTRYFPQYLRWNLLPGDIIHVPEVPNIVKSRPLSPDNANSVIMKLDKIRHFTFVKDKKQFTDKKNMIIYRGHIGCKATRETGEFKENRYRFMEMYFNHPMCNVGEIKTRSCNPEFLADKLTIGQHLDYKFIMTLEGNDVASNLKWVMSSNSIAVMPKPTCETWYMEGTLIPNYHYIEIKPDFSDLIDRVNYYIAHPEEAQAIINHAHEYIEQFKNEEREKLISLMVLDKYFKSTNKNY